MVRFTAEVVDELEEPVRDVVLLRLELPIDLNLFSFYFLIFWASLLAHSWLLLFGFLLFSSNSSFARRARSTSAVTHDLCVDHDQHRLHFFEGQSFEGWPGDLHTVHLCNRFFFPLHSSPGGSPPHSPFPLFQA